MSTIDPIDKLITEWSWRCEKGYPDLNNPKDMAILKEVLHQFDITLEEVEERIEEDTRSTADKLLYAIRSLPEEGQEVVMKQFSTLPEETKEAMGKEINTHSINSFNSNLKSLGKLFSPFYGIRVSGAGPGELLPLITLKDSRSGGTAEKDIIVDGKVIEVKELDAGKKFRTGKTGSIRDTKLDANVQTLVRLIRDIDGVKELADLREKILKYYETTYKFGSGKPGFFTKDLKTYIDKIKELDLEHKEYVKVDGKKYFYKRDEEGRIVLQGEAEKDLISLAKLKRHKYYRDFSALVSDFENVKNRYLDSIDFLLLYNKGNPVPVLLSRDQAKDKIVPYDVSQQTIRLGYGRPSTIALEEYDEDYWDDPPDA